MENSQQKAKDPSKIWGSMQFFIVTSTHSYHQVIRYAYVCIAFLGVFNSFLCLTSTQIGMN